jgi:hypothetical protein
MRLRPPRRRAGELDAEARIAAAERANAIERSVIYLAVALPSLPKDPTP